MAVQFYIESAGKALDTVTLEEETHAVLLRFRDELSMPYYTRAFSGASVRLTGDEAGKLYKEVTMLQKQLREKPALLKEQAVAVLAAREEILERAIKETTADPSDLKAELTLVRRQKRMWRREGHPYEQPLGQRTITFMTKLRLLCQEAQRIEAAVRVRMTAAGASQPAGR